MDKSLKVITLFFFKKAKNVDKLFRQLKVMDSWLKYLTRADDEWLKRSNLSDE